MEKEENFTIIKRSRIDYPRSSFKQIKEDILGADYCLSLVFIGDKRSRYLNETYRGKASPANILSFPLSPDEGEIFINLRKARDTAPDFQMSFREFVLYLFIHGILHLKGMQHSGTMEKEEKRLFSYYMH
ncbi:MAG: rRNA maturation RNase YbeY [Candidatus Paceibacterota bacterium]